MAESGFACPSCDSPLPESATFCVLCGALISPSGATAAPAPKETPEKIATPQEAPTKDPATAETPPDPLALPPRPVAPAPKPVVEAPPKPVVASRTTAASSGRPPPAAPLATPSREPSSGLVPVVVASVLGVAIFVSGVFWLATRQTGRLLMDEALTESPAAPAVVEPSPSPSPSRRPVVLPSPVATPSPTPSPSPEPVPSPSPSSALVPMTEAPPPPPEPSPSPVAPSPTPTPSPPAEPSVDARAWDGHGWRRTPAGHKHGPGCGHVFVARRWRFFAEEPVEYEGSLEDFHRKKPENGIYDFRGKTYWLRDHVHSDDCIHKLGADGWYLPEPD